MIPEINRNIELIQILIYLSDVKNMTRQSLSNTVYCTAIDKWFVQFKNHSAVIMTRDMIINQHFNYARPHKAALRLPEIINSEIDELHDWATEVARFINDTQFDSFFQSQREYYDWILKTISDCNFDAWIHYIEHYFRSKTDGFCLIICPLDGNYGFNLKLNDGKDMSYTIRCMPYYNNEVPTWQFDFFAKGIAHEYAHCFVNPIIESHTDILKNHNAFFKAHKNMLDYYNTDYAVINEYFVRAFAIRFMEVWNFEGFDINAE
ncbi:MAG: DUF4932 domain-containing protein, partial [Oscillospiraceae bacterium]